MRIWFGAVALWGIFVLLYMTAAYGLGALAVALLGVHPAVPKYFSLGAMLHGAFVTFQLFLAVLAQGKQATK